ncbi:hypothetical protein SAMN05216474_0134 [Lishizhenia tianjinensis]|uniref:Uncharacterized protein n=1 Tax=Lishizhenia tianjinensis TaxID=477690 RepID=A0A1I6XEH8_9FLAO|nr:hypothetical protein [Lishizhenia tianjinensis]SFT36587.1 hypothetical protein SAMN05216474_0134 [Lishizhenia tianjinensis]
MKKIVKQTKKPFNKTLLLVTFLVFAGLIFFSFLQAWNAEVQLNNVSAVTLFFAESYDLLRYPLHSLLNPFVDLTEGSGVFMYFLFLILNAALYAVVFERAYNLMLIKKRR